MGKTIEGTLQGQGLKIAIAVGRFNRAITQRLLEGALERFKRLGVREDDLDVVWVPGAFELPQAVRALIKTRKYDGVLPLGCVIRGETPHFEYICQAVTQGLTQLALQSDLPIVYGVITADTPQQALERAGVKGNKGAEAAEALVELIHALRALNARA
jgi:6,7-dimethyl-8-ribityllumazine synthase